MNHHWCKAKKKMRGKNFHCANGRGHTSRHRWVED